VNSNRCDVTATQLDESGWGVGTSAGKRVHVADLLPGESAEVAIDHASPHRPEAWARIVRRVKGGIVAEPSQIAREGHLMVVASTHTTAFAQMTEEDAAAFMALVTSVARDAEVASSAGRCYVLRIGDKAPHLHFHIVPVVAGDPPLAPHVFGEDGWSGGL
jgi:diadenosine tetraphosphate (Ap4A) HIT family hydrolase